MSARYAVFFCPDDASELGLFGKTALRRCADGSGVRPSSHDYPDQVIARELSATASHYGFHATLKAPFQLSDGSSEPEFLDAVEHLAKQQTAIVMDALQPKTFSEFLALSFASSQPLSVCRLAEQCVKKLEPFRAPLSDEDLRKRRPEELSVQQREYLAQYGYPYVLDEFRFHMTLTGKLKHGDHDAYIDWISELYATLVREAPVLDRIVVCSQPDRATRFTRLEQFAFA